MWHGDPKDKASDYELGDCRFESFFFLRENKEKNIRERIKFNILNRKMGLFGDH